MSPHKFLKFFHLFLALVVPLFSIVVLGIVNGLFSIQTTAWGGYLALLFLVYPVAIYAVYAGIIFLHFFPVKISDAIQVFIPSLLSILFLVSQWAGIQNLQSHLILEAVPLYLGIYVCLLFGVAYLGWKKTKGRKAKEYVSRLVVGLILLSPIVGTAIPLIRFAHDLIQTLGWSFFRQLFFWAQIGVVISVYYPKIVKLYIAKKL